MRTVLILAVVALCACTQPDRTKKLLEAQGYTDIQTHGYDFFACGKDDETATEFSAKSPNGTAVKGAVCAGWFFKGATIRFD
jgi:hypothetical protein